MPMIYAAIGYWGIGLAARRLARLRHRLRGVGIWIGLATGLAVSRPMLWRWLRRDRLRPGRLPPQSNRSRPIGGGGFVVQPHQSRNCAHAGNSSHSISKCHPGY